MKKVSLLLAVVLTFALLLGFGVNGAQADSVLFPYVSMQPGVYSFITLGNTGFGEFASMTGYHLSYGYKSVPVNNKQACLHADGNIVSTPADLVTFEVSGKVTDGGSNVLFETPAPNTSTAFPLASATNHVGFLVAEPIGNVGAENTNQIQAFGWADIIDTVNNMGLSYSTDATGVNTSIDPDFNVSQVGTTWYSVSWMPTAYVTTSWYVLPLGLRSAMTPVGGGGIRSFVRANDGIYAGAFDRDEQFWSGEKMAPIRCLGIVTTADFLQPFPISMTEKGGYVPLESWGGPLTLGLGDADDPGGVYTADDLLVYKIQVATSAAGLGKVSTISAEPQLDPLYDITLDVGP